MRMDPNKLLLCTDLDRTVIPNGRAPEHPAARRSFADFCRLPEVDLVYVTGRHRALVKQAIQSYDLPEPDFAITDVGTRIYRIVSGQWLELTQWGEEIAADWHGKSHAEIKEALSPLPQLRLQEESKQNTHKLSYYLSLEADREEVLAGVAQRLRRMGVDASLIWSIDEAEEIGLLDVLPRNATKLHGIQFLQQLLGYPADAVIFAGDSGNDLPVLASSIRSVLVANAGAEIKRQAQQLAEGNNHGEALYLAVDANFPLGGNYTAGVLQGVWHFMPAWRHKLPQMEGLP